MYTKQVFVTNDGSQFDTFSEAKRHANKCYKDAIAALAVEITRLDWKYQATFDFLDANASRLSALAALQAEALQSQDDFEDED